MRRFLLIRRLTERADRIWQVNVAGSWRCATAVVPTMRDAGYGRIVNVSSTMGSLNRMTGWSGPTYRVFEGGAQRTDPNPWPQN